MISLQEVTWCSYSQLCCLCEKEEIIDTKDKKKRSGPLIFLRRVKKLAKKLARVYTYSDMNMWIYVYFNYTTKLTICWKRRQSNYCHTIGWWWTSKLEREREREKSLEEERGEIIIIMKEVYGLLIEVYSKDWCKDTIYSYIRYSLLQCTVLMYPWVDDDWFNLLHSSKEV